MLSSASATWNLWNSYRRKSLGEISYVIYVAGWLSLITFVPLCRYLWLVATNAVVATQLLGVFTPNAIALGTAVIAIVALIAGKTRGPAVIDPFLATVLAESPISQNSSFSRPVRASVLACSAGGGLVGVCVALGLWGSGLASLTPLVFLVIGGTCVGVLIATLWLTGQSGSPRLLVALVGCVLALLLAHFSNVNWELVNPLTWTAILASGGGGWPIATGVVGLALVALGLIPRMRSRLDPDVVIMQSRRWDVAIAHASLMDFSASAEVYTAVPSIRRDHFVIRGFKTIGMVLFWRDALASLRMPGRLSAGALAAGVAGALTLAATSGVPGSWLIGACAGFLAYLASGPVTDGLRHMAYFNETLPLYGGRSALLLIGSTTWSYCFLSVTLVCGALLGALLGFPISVHFSLAAGLFCLVVIAARVASALKPAMPIALLMPVPTPVGDISVLYRLLWSADSMVISVAAAILLASQEAPWLGLGSLLLIAVWLVFRRSRQH